MLASRRLCEDLEASLCHADRVLVLRAQSSELGAKLLCICSNVHEDALGEPERSAADLAELADLAARRGYRIGYEALAWGKHVKDWMQAWDIVRMADRPNLGIVLDSFHICVRNNPIAPIADLPPTASRWCRWRTLPPF
jgi:sugar phosphate isomerase/epimerase